MRYFGPFSMLNYLNIAARQGILIKDGRSIELLRDIDTVVFDKTGTLTLEQPQVKHIHSCSGLSADEILTFAAAAEDRQSHPIACAILAEADSRQLDFPPIEDIHYEIGYGIKVQIRDQTVRVGSDRFMAMEGILIPDKICQLQSSCHQEGYSLVMIAIDGELAGAIELRSTVRPEAMSIIRQLQERQLELVIISGDHEGPTRQLAQQLGIERYFAQVLPEDKAKLVEQLQQEGHSVCFVGDGINDAIALKKAKVSISLRGATTLATDTAQIVLMDGKLTKLIDLFKIAQEFEENLKINLAISTIPAFLCIGGVFLLRWSALTTVVITESVFVAGLMNSTWPLFKYIK
jgi:Cu2+-exporting ATPase